MNHTTPSTRPVATLPQRTSGKALPATQSLPFRVLQTGHAPAQLSLFLRPGISTKR